MSDQEPAAREYETNGRLDHAGWTNALRDGTLLGQQCSECETKTATPKAACPSCGARELVSIRLPDGGEVLSETTIQVSPEGFEGPFTVGIVDLGDTNIMVRFDTAVSIGDSVRFSRRLETERGVTPVFTDDGSE